MVANASLIIAMAKRNTFAGIPARYALAIIGFFGSFNVYAMRVNLSVALVAMVNDSASTSADDTSETACSDLLPQLANRTSQQKHKGDFQWDSHTQSLVLGAFFYGYVITQIPSGIMAERFGAKWLFGIGMLITSLLTLMSPIAARAGVVPFVIVRVIEGLAEGAAFPAVNTMIGHWVPKMERSRISTIVYTGSPVGTVVAMALSGVLVDSNFLGGWPSVFYIFGLLGCIWFLCWTFLVYENPEDHPRISLAELQYIRGAQNKQKKLKVPWTAILSSYRVWALAITHFGGNWGYYTLLTEMPTYLANILHFNMKQNGVLSALPYIMEALFGMIASILADKMRQNGRFSITTIRKIINSVAYFGPGFCLVAVVFVGCRPFVIVGLLCFAIGLHGCSYSGYNVTHVDMSPELAGTLMGITNCISNFSGFLAPYVVGQIVSQGQTQHNWALVFFISAGVFFFTGLVYDVFCSAELQPWSVSEDEHQSPNPVLSIKKEKSLPTITEISHNIEKT